jgi:hypothetical protein
VKTSATILHATVSAADPESPNYAALQGFMFRASSTSSPVVDSLNMRTAVRREVEPFSLPDQEQATQLIRRFFKTTGSLYPYLDEEAFLNTYQQSAIGNVRSLRGSWLALLNMVFAMATHAGHNQGPLPSESDSDHDLFYQRALILCKVDFRCATSLEIGKSLIDRFRKAAMTDDPISAIATSDESVSTRHRTFYRDLQHP